MSDSRLQLVVKSIPKAIMSPKAALALAWRRLFPFGIVPKDPEAYRIGSWSYGGAERLSLVRLFPGIEDSEVTLIRAFDRDPNTSMDFSEVVQLCAIARHINAKRILEIGTFDGNTTLNLAANTSEDCIITTVDLPTNWDGTYELRIPRLYDNATDGHEVGMQFLEDGRYLQRIRQVLADSGELDYSALGGPFDLVFIDGNHHRAYVEKDTQNALAHTRSGGVVAWHDYGMIRDVSDVVDDLLGHDVSVIRGTRIAIARV